MLCIYIFFKVRYTISYTMSVMQSTLLPLGRIKQQYKSQNGDEKVPIHPTINPGCIPRPIPNHAAL